MVIVEMEAAADGGSEPHLAAGLVAADDESFAVLALDGEDAVEQFQLFERAVVIGLLQLVEQMHQRGICDGVEMVFVEHESDYLSCVLRAGSV